jgi:hypothetical protein
MKTPFSNSLEGGTEYDDFSVDLELADLEYIWIGEYNIEKLVL